MEETFDVGLFYLDGSYRLTTLTVRDGEWPKYVNYGLEKFIVHNKLPDGRYQYKEVEEPFDLVLHSPLQQAEDESEELSMENLCMLVEEQETRIEGLVKAIESYEETIISLRRIIHQLRSEK